MRDPFVEALEAITALPEEKDPRPLTLEEESRWGMVYARGHYDKQEEWYWMPCKFCRAEWPVTVEAGEPPGIKRLILEHVRRCHT